MCKKFPILELARARPKISLHAKISHGGLPASSIDSVYINIYIYIHVKRGKNTISSKIALFDNKLHNETATYSKSTTMRTICITNIIYGIYNT